MKTPLDLLYSSWGNIIQTFGGKEQGDQLPYGILYNAVCVCCMCMFMFICMHACRHVEVRASYVFASSKVKVIHTYCHT